MSDDGASSIVVIALLGNPFSPRWARARRDHVTRPHEAPPHWRDYCAMNVSLRNRRGSSWTMTEHPASAVERGRDDLRIGRSALRFDGDDLVVSIDERTAPWGRPIRGRVRLRPLVGPAPEVQLDGAGGDYHWQALAPIAHVEVDLDEPRVRFRGRGYFDTNHADRPLEDGLAAWSWSRLATEDEVAIAYDVVPRSGRAQSHGFIVDGAGRPRPNDAAVSTRLDDSFFGLERTLRAGDARRSRLVATTEDGPFYARSVVEGALGCRTARGMHEVISFDRLASRWVQFLLPYRMRIERPR